MGNGHPIEQNAANSTEKDAGKPLDITPLIGRRQEPLNIVPELYHEHATALPQFPLTPTDRAEAQRLSQLPGVNPFPALMLSRALEHAMAGNLKALSQLTMPDKIDVLDAFKRVMDSKGYSVSTTKDGIDQGSLEIKKNDGHSPGLMITPDGRVKPLLSVRDHLPIGPIHTDHSVESQARQISINLKHRK